MHVSFIYSCIYANVIEGSVKKIVVSVCVKADMRVTKLPKFVKSMNGRINLGM